MTEDHRKPMSLEPARRVLFPGELRAANSEVAPGVRGLDVTAGLSETGSMNQNVLFKKLREDVVLPQKGSFHAAGYDLATPEAVRFEPGERKTISLGFATAIVGGFHGRIESRSGLALKGLVVLTGVIDSDYRGEWKVIMQNFSPEVHEFAAGDRVAQVVFRPTVTVNFTAVQELPETFRGAGGFGSTGE